MNRERAIGMIRKLVELAQGTPYEHEAAAAMDKAEELLRRHGLAMAECRMKPQGCKAQERPSSLGRVPQWLGNLFAGIAEVFDCAPITSRRWILERERLETFFVFVGQPEDVELADFLFELAWKVINSHLKATKVGRRFKRDYAFGVAIGVLRQVRAMRPETPAQEEFGLLLHKDAELKKYLKERFDIRWDGMKYHDGGFDPAVAAAGAKVGQELQLTMGLKMAHDSAPKALGQGILALGA